MNIINTPKGIWGGGGGETGPVPDKVQVFLKGSYPTYNPR